VVALAAALAAGCGGRPEARLQYVQAGTEETVIYESGTYELVRDGKVRIVLFAWDQPPPRPADAGFEYVSLEIPERKTYGWLRQEGVPAYRWVHRDGRDHVWLGTAGQVRMRPAQDKRHVHVDLRMTMEPVAGTVAEAFVFLGDLRFKEDSLLTQGLINRFGPRLGEIVRKPSSPGP
jgi:hypothetical protein